MQPENPARLPLGLAAVFGFLTVALGAFGAHALKDRLPAGDLTIFETAVRYQAYHALALLSCAVLTGQGYRCRTATIAFGLGITIFSGSLYTLVFTGWRFMGAITPIGGVALLVGWIALGCSRRGKPAH